MKIDRSDSMPMSQAPEATFIGDVQVGGYFRREAPSRLAGATVIFAPGAHTPWKANPLGQTLVILSGRGWVQAEGEEVVEVQTGDIIWWPPGERHWEGATPDEKMSYFAFQEEVSGKMVSFGDAVTEKEYRRSPPRA